MAMYFKKSYKHNKPHHTCTDSHHPSTNHNSIHADRHKCKSHNTNDQVNEIIWQTHVSRNTKSEPEDIKDPHNSDSPDSNLDSSPDSEWLSWADKIIEVKISNMKYATNFPVTINKNDTILFDAGATISCMSKACFDKLQPKPALVQTHTYKVNGANGNSLSPIRTTTCTLEFLEKFQQKCIVWEHLLQPVILGLDFSHNNLIGIDCFSANQLPLHPGPKSIIISDPAPFPLHFIQISMLPPPHILVKTISQITIPPRMLAIVHATINSIHKPGCYYNFIDMSIPCRSQQNLFVVLVLNIF